MCFARILARTDSLIGETAALAFDMRCEVGLPAVSEDAAPGYDFGVDGSSLGADLLTSLEP